MSLQPLLRRDSRRLARRILSCGKPHPFENVLYSDRKVVVRTFLIEATDKLTVFPAAFDQADVLVSLAPYCDDLLSCEFGF